MSEATKSSLANLNQSKKNTNEFNLKLDLDSFHTEFEFDNWSWDSNTLSCTANHTGKKHKDDKWVTFSSKSITLPNDIYKKIENDFTNDVAIVLKVNYSGKSTPFTGAVKKAGVGDDI